MEFDIEHWLISHDDEFWQPVGNIAQSSLIGATQGAGAALGLAAGLPGGAVTAVPSTVMGLYGGEAVGQQLVQEIDGAMKFLVLGE